MYIYLVLGNFAEIDTGFRSFQMTVLDFFRYTIKLLKNNDRFNFSNVYASVSSILLFFLGQTVI